MPIPRYHVTLSTPDGPRLLEVASRQGPEEAGRQAADSFARLSLNTPDDVSVVSVEPARTPDSAWDASARAA